MLASRVEAFCCEFLPGGARNGDEWRCADIYGAAPSKGKQGSFVVHMGGKWVGTFYENGDGPVKKGSLLDIIMAQRNVEFKDALRIAGEWLGIDTSARSPLRRVTATPAERMPSPAPPPRVRWQEIGRDSRAGNYLAGERGLDVETARRYRVGMSREWFPGHPDKEADAIVFPAWSPDNKELLMVKYLAIDRPDGARFTRCNKGAVYHLIGMPVAEDLRAAKPDRPLVICEGEIDMLTVASLGFAAVSVPFGAKADTDDNRSNAGNAWIENDWEWLSEWKDIIICMDGDPAGQAAAATLLRRLGAERCRVASFGTEAEDKDPNAVHLHDPEALPEIIERARPCDPEALRSAASFREEIWDEFFKHDIDMEGITCPWDTSDKFPFRFRLGELTAWQGYTKHGKTTLLTYCLVHFAANDQPCCIASLEIKARKTLRNVMRMVVGKSRPVNDHTREPDQGLFDRAVHWLDRKFWIYDNVGEPNIDDVLEVFRYAARRYGLKHFVLDSLMKLSLNEEDYPTVKGVLNKLSAFAREYDVHVHLVAHSKKPSEKRPEGKYWPDKYQMSGSASLANIPHNVICVYRNVSKEAAMEDRIAKLDLARASGVPDKDCRALEAELDKLEMLHDAMFVVQAQREGDGSHPIMRLFFDKGHSWQYMRTRDNAPTKYVS